MAQATICDYCGYLVEGDVARVTEDVVFRDDDVLTTRVAATTEEYHPECRTAMKQMCEDKRPSPPSLPGSTPNVPGEPPPAA